MKKALVCVLCLVFWRGLLGGEPPAETVISREDADRIFSLIKPEWEKVARRSYYPGWTIQLNPHDTGPSLKAFDSSRRFGVSVQPIYDDNTSPPKSLLIGTSYPVEFWAEGIDRILSRIKSASRKNLGPAYSVSLVHQRVNRLDVIELLITKREGTSH